jgi:superfamily I DNA/RNA helicase
MSEAATVGRVLVWRGAIAAEAHLLEELCGLARAGSADPRSLRSPVLVIVASRSLREHLSARLVERCGRAIAGISIRTLGGLVASILARAGEPAESDDALFPALIRQLAREEASLRESFDGLNRGYAPVVGEVTDLLDAGLESTHADAAIELIGEAGRGPLAKRAEAVVRVAARASEQLGVLGISHLSSRVRRACELLDADPEHSLPARAVFVFGFADATGLQMDLIETLLRRCGACVYLDHPADPADPARSDPGVAFSDRFSARMRGAVGVEASDLSESPSPGEVHLLRAPGSDAEVRGVANRIRVQIDAGVAPERIAVVARNLDLYRCALRVQFSRLGIPFSGVDPPEVVTAAVRRRLLTLQSLLRAGPRAPVDPWLDLLYALPSSGHSSLVLGTAERSDLRAAFHALGVARLVNAARFEASSDLSPSRLPRRGLSTSVGGVPEAPRRELPPGHLAAAISAARELSGHLEKWPDRARLSSHLEALRKLATEHLRWRTDDSDLEAFFSICNATANGEFELDREDFQLYFDRRAEKILAPPIGGKGGGVAVLSVEQARSRTFDRLFLIGLSREIFPRTIGESPLLPDRLRRSLRALLPDLPVKREGYDEERYLFAQLLSSSPNVVASYSTVDEGGRTRPASPLLERLRSSSPVDLPGFWQSDERADPRPLRPAHEHAQIAGLSGERAQFARVLRVAVDEQVESDPDACKYFGAPDVEDRTAARLVALEEWDPSGNRRFELGPYYGFVGSIAEAADPRRAPLYVTRIENIAKCPWQTFVNQLLRIEPLPDALAELPDADAMIIGNLVHRTLQKIVSEHCSNGEETLDEVLLRDPISISWPDGDQLQELLKRETRALLRAEGIATPGFERVLIDQARRCVETARGLDWPDGASDVGVLGVEVEGVIAVNDCSGAQREVRFRADRVDRMPAGLRLIDYKTGKAVVEQKTESARRKNLIKGISRGFTLQAAAYALSGPQLENNLSAEGRYLYVGVNTPEHARVADVDSSEDDSTEAFTRAVQIAIEAWDRGSFTPRLIDSLDGKEPRRCERCSVKEACLRGDSGSRYRIERWAEFARTTDSLEPIETQRAAIRLWDLGVEKS